MKFCKYCANPDEYNEYVKKCIIKHRNIGCTDILTKDNALKINGVSFANITVTIERGNELTIVVSDSHDPIFSIINFNTKKIKYCPMCGRKLEPYKY